MLKETTKCFSGSSISERKTSRCGEPVHGGLSGTDRDVEMAFAEHVGDYCIRIRASALELLGHNPADSPRMANGHIDASRVSTIELASG
jgi:hypothetical protein